MLKCLQYWKVHSSEDEENEVGLDVHKEMSYGTVVDGNGNVIERGKAPSSYDGIC